MPKAKYTLEQLTLIIKNSKSIAQVLNKLNLKPAGGNYITIKKIIKKQNIDTKHFNGQSWSKGKKLRPRKNINFYLKKDNYVQTNRLKKRLIAENIFERVCTNCKMTKWLDKPIPLELHHIDGCCTNNELTNLTLLCPNCHALTDNYRGKNK